MSDYAHSPLRLGWQPMNTVNLHMVYSLGMSLEGLVLKVEEATADDKVLSRSDRKKGKAAFESILRDCVMFEYPCSAAAVARLLKRVNEKDLTFGEVREAVRDIKSRLFDEIQKTFCIALTQHERDCVRFSCGPHLTTRFPSLVQDLEEASRCHGLGRHTACAFHSLRAVEVCIKAIHACLQLPGISDSTRSWAKYLSPIGESLKSRKKDGHTNLLEASYAQLCAANLAWRNPTMHVERHYNADEARDINYASNALVMQLAQYMDETGSLSPARVDPALPGAATQLPESSDSEEPSKNNGR